MAGAPLQIDATELARWRAAAVAPVLLDVREPWEVALAHVADATHIPLGELQRRVAELPDDRPIVVMCHHGMRSMQATQWLRGQGFDAVTNLAGGIDGWSVAVDPAVPRY